jgi:hypothetical protein
MKAIFTIRQDLLGDVISWVDGGPYNHCGVYDNAVDNRGGFIIEATPFEGVRRRLLGPVLGSVAGFAIVDLPLPEEEQAMAWLRAQVGKGYDWMGLAGILFGTDWMRDNRWVCSPLTIMTFMQAGATLDGGGPPGFNYVMGVRQAYDTLQNLGAKVTSLSSPISKPPRLPKQ